MHSEYDNRRRSHIGNMSVISCIRALIVANIMIQLTKSIISSIVLYVAWDQAIESPLRLFLSGFIVLCVLRGATFFSKNRSFFRINRILEYEENNDVGVLSNLVEGFSIFWYLLGYHWIQECEECAIKHPLVYYTCITWLVLAFVMFVAPLVAIVLLLVVVHYVKPKLKEITYNQESDVPDGNLRCVICYENYRPGVILKFLPCEHHFHTECINEWFRVRDSCPLCKKSINILYDLIESNENPV